MHPSHAPAARDGAAPVEPDRTTPRSNAEKDGPAVRPAGPLRRRLGLWLVLLITGAGGLGGAYWFGLRSLRQPAVPAQTTSRGTENPASEKTVAPERVVLRRTTSQPASVRALFEAKISARVSGYLKELKADIGDRVEEGQLLAVIDAPELGKKRDRLKAEVERLEAEEVQARVEAETASAFVRVAEAQVTVARAEVKKAEAKLDAERSELRRLESASKSGIIDQGVLNEVRSRVQSAEAGQAAALAAVRTAEAGVEYAKAKHRLATAAVATAAARRKVAVRELEEAELWVGYARIVAPFRGAVTARGVDPGDLVGDPQRGKLGPLFTVARLDRVRVQVHLPERDAPWLDVGDAAEFRPEAFPGKVVTGTVTRSANGLDPQTRTLEVEVELPNPDVKLLPGMYGQVTIVLEQRPDALVLPARSVTFDKAGKANVFVLGEGGSVRALEVATGLDDGHRVEILRGLSGGERVIESPTAATATPPR